MPDALGRDLTQLAREGLLDPVVGRGKEIERLGQILSRRTRHNPVLVGEPGVGRTAVFAGLAQRIAAGNVPDRLKGKELRSLGHGGDPGEALAEARSRDDVVLLVDDISALPPGDYADVFVVCIATPESYRRITAEKPALAELFQPVRVAEMSAETAVEVLRVVRDRLAEHHHLVIGDSALFAAVQLAAKYDRRQRLPRSAIDLVDEACARSAGAAHLSVAVLGRTMQDLRADWQSETQSRRPGRTVPEAFRQVYGGAGSQIWRIG